MCTLTKENSLSMNILEPKNSLQLLKQGSRYHRMKQQNPEVAVIEVPRHRGLNQADTPPIGSLIFMKCLYSETSIIRTPLGPQ